MLCITSNDFILNLEDINLNSDNPTSLFLTTSSTTVSPSTSSNIRPRKRFLDILLQTSSTTEEDTEEEVSVPLGVKKTKRRRRNFSSSTSSSYSSSLTTISTVNSSSLNSAKKNQKEKQSSKEVKKDLIAYRTRSRTQSIEKSVVDLETAPKPHLLVSRRKSRSSKTQLVSDKEVEDTYNNQDNSKRSSEVLGEKKLDKKRILESYSESPGKTSENSKSSKRRKNISQSSCKHEEGVSRRLRSQSATDLLQKRSVPKTIKPKKQNQSGQKSSPGCSTSTNPESKGIGLNKSVNLGARIARNQSGREPQHNSDQSDSTTPQSSSRRNQIETGHLPFNLLRRSSRGKGATTGSCVSIDLTNVLNCFQ